MTNVPQILRIRCHYCSKWHHPKEVLDIGVGGVKMCFRCHEWHIENIRAIVSQGVPVGCFECRKTWAELRLLYRPGDNPDEVKMSVVPRDGIYQLLCGTCSDAYERKRGDLIRDTLYGQQKGV
jgi:hypothetical protein